MKEIFIDDIRKIQLAMMDFIDSLCREKGIRYSLSCGTLLGAVRHHGYIPWDDDIDIFMLRPDYERIIEEIKKSENSRYRILTPFTDSNYYYPFAKLCDMSTRILEGNDRSLPEMGVYIDIFPVDGLPNDARLRKRYWNRIRIVKKFNTMIYQKKVRGEGFVKGVFRRVIFFLFKPMASNRLARYLNILATKCSVGDSEFIACSIFGYGEREQLPASVFSEFIDIPFEQKQYRAIKNYDLYLSNLYGDYMTLPPAEQRQRKHGFHAFVGGGNAFDFHMR